MASSYTILCEVDLTPAFVGAEQRGIISQNATGHLKCGCINWMKAQSMSGAVGNCPHVEKFIEDRLDANDRLGMEVVIPMGVLGGKPSFDAWLRRVATGEKYRVELNLGARIGWHFLCFAQPNEGRLMMRTAIENLLIALAPDAPECGSTLHDDTIAPIDPTSPYGLVQTYRLITEYICVRCWDDDPF
jgi:hypothetical protein